MTKTVNESQFLNSKFVKLKELKSERDLALHAYEKIKSLADKTGTLTEEELAEVLNLSNFSREFTLRINAFMKDMFLSEKEKKEILLILNAEHQRLSAVLDAMSSVISEKRKIWKSKYISGKKQLNSDQT